MGEGGRGGGGCVLAKLHLGESGPEWSTQHLKPARAKEGGSQGNCNQVRGGEEERGGGGRRAERQSGQGTNVKHSHPKLQNRRSVSIRLCKLEQSITVLALP